MKYVERKICWKIGFQGTKRFPVRLIYEYTALLTLPWWFFFLLYIFVRNFCRLSGVFSVDSLITVAVAVLVQISALGNTEG